MTGHPTFIVVVFTVEPAIVGLAFGPFLPVYPKNT